MIIPYIMDENPAMTGPPVQPGPGVAKTPQNPIQGSKKDTNLDSVLVDIPLFDELQVASPGQYV